VSRADHAGTPPVRGCFSSFNKAGALRRGSRRAAGRRASKRTDSMGLRRLTRGSPQPRDRAASPPSNFNEAAATRHRSPCHAASARRRRLASMRPRSGRGSPADKLCARDAMVASIWPWHHGTDHEAVKAGSASMRPWQHAADHSCRCEKCRRTWPYFNEAAASQLRIVGCCVPELRTTTCFNGLRASRYFEGARIVLAPLQ